ncbi:MAG: PAS domain S-box protein [Bacteroidetes bacterium]|nr:PAS domain S-box protein [Bacteroidota bacterium]MBU1116582.1 PAS domain S-box protein [Bacteroidota bacterium]MBU1797196.1 PAS domain S-box protein [Bacteroidota bacterium]
MENYNKELEELRSENERLKNILDEKNRASILSTEKKYHNLFMELKDVLYESTPEGKLLDINPSGIELFGYDSKEDIMKINIAEDLYVNPEERDRLIEKIENDGFVKDYEIKIKNKSGKEIIVTETSFMLKNDAGKVLGYTGIIRDVTETKLQEKLLREYNEELANLNIQLKISEDELKKINDEKDKFFSIIAHDLKSPFNALLNLSEFLVEDLPELSMEEIRSFSKEINISAHSVYNLLLNLLQWAQIKTGRFSKTQEKLDMADLASKTIMLLENLASKKSIKIKNSIDLSHNIIGDKTMISSVMQNLISNAIKFTKRNGDIDITSEENSGKVIIHIKDTGVGISVENLNKLFKLDEHLTTVGTANESGTGLGLILCRELLEKNNGKIWADSTEGFGATFSFSLDKA